QRCERGSVLGFYTVRDEGEYTEPKSQWEFTKIGLKLGMRSSNVCLSSTCLFELHDANGHAVAVQHHVETAFEVIFNDGYLVNRDVLIVGFFRTDDADGGCVLLTVRIEIGHTVSIGHHPVDTVVFGNSVLRCRRNNFS